MGFASFQGEFCRPCFFKAYYLTSILQHVSPLAVGAFGCHSVLVTLPLKFTKTKKNVIKAVKVVLGQFKLAIKSPIKSLIFC